MDDKLNPGQRDGTIMVNEKKPKGRFRQKRVVIPLFILILAGLGVFYYWNEFLRGYVSTDDAFIESDDVTISSKLLGRVSFLAYGEGDTVSEGDTLVKLDDSDLKAQQAQAEANLQYAEKNVALAEINLSKAKDDFSRATIQYQGNAITREQYDHANQAVEAASAQRDVAGSQVGTARAQLGVIETQLKNTEIIAPFSGVVAKRWVLVGDVVQAAQPIYTIYDQQHAWVDAYLEETQIAELHIGDTVEISVDAYSGHKLAGTISMIGATAASQFSLIPPNNASGNFTKVTQRIPVKIAIPGQKSSGMQLRAGMSVEIKIKVSGS
jgi:membrane fusion protein, multidrug efflux system